MSNDRHPSKCAFVDQVTKPTAVPDSPGTLVFVHIGKCGGSTLWHTVKESSHLTSTYRCISRSHVVVPANLRNAHYAITIRNPVDRAISAFNWRYKLLIVDKSRPNSPPSEAAVLKKYGTLNALAEQLSNSPQAYADLMTIGHIKQNIAFYLRDLVDNIRSDQIIGLLAAETLEQDAQRVLGRAPVARRNAHRENTPSAQLILSQAARDNLKEALHEDYTCLKALLDLAPKTAASRDVLLA